MIYYNDIEFYEIPECEGYLVSKCGKVLSIRPINGRGGCNIKYAKIMKLSLSKAGYMRICLKVNKKEKIMFVHRLVTKTFLEDYTEDLVVDHKDHDTVNNNLSNLRMVTSHHNQRNRKNTVGFSRKCDKRRNTFYYTTSWSDDANKKKHASFSINKYGEVFAYLLAYNLRQEMVNKYYNRPTS